MKQKKQRTKWGRPRGSKGKPKTREGAIVKHLGVLFENLTKDLLLSHGLYWEDVQGELEAGRDISAKSYFLMGVYWVIREVFPRFIRNHAKNIELKPYAKKVAIAKHAWEERGASRKQLKAILPDYFPSKAVRAAKSELYGSNITQEEFKKVMNRENDLKTLKIIAKESGLTEQRIEEIVKYAIRRKLNVSTPLKDGEKVLALGAGKPEPKNKRVRPEHRRR